MAGQNFSLEKYEKKKKFCTGPRPVKPKLMGRYVPVCTPFNLSSLDVEKIRCVFVM